MTVRDDRAITVVLAVSLVKNRVLGRRRSGEFDGDPFKATITSEKLPILTPVAVTGVLEVPFVADSQAFDGLIERDGETCQSLGEPLCPIPFRLPPCREPHHV